MKILVLMILHNYVHVHMKAHLEIRAVQQSMLCEAFNGSMSLFFCLEDGVLPYRSYRLVTFGRNYLVDRRKMLDDFL